MKNSTHFAKVIEIFTRKLEKICPVDHQLFLGKKLLWTKTTTGIHQMSANQLLELMRVSSIPMCQDMQTGLNTRCVFDSDMQKFKARHNRSCNFENMVMSYYQETRSECRIESFHTSANQKKIDCYNVDGCCDHCKTVFGVRDVINFFVTARKLVAHLAMKTLREETKGEKGMTWDVSIFAKKRYKIEEMWACEWWQNFKTNEKIKSHIWSNFP